MPATHETGFDIGHPAPDRGRIGGWWLLFGLVGGAVAWSVELGLLAALGGAACAVGDGPKSLPAGPEWAQVAEVVINILALLVAAASLAVSWRNLNRTHRMEKGDVHGMVDAGEGRTRFMAIWGIFANVLFLLAIGFNTVSVFWIGLCES